MKWGQRAGKYQEAKRSEKHSLAWLRTKEKIGCQSALSSNSILRMVVICTDVKTIVRTELLYVSVGRQVCWWRLTFSRYCCISIDTRRLQRRLTSKSIIQELCIVIPKIIDSRPFEPRNLAISLHCYFDKVQSNQRASIRK